MQLQTRRYSLKDVITLAWRASPGATAVKILQQGLLAGVAPTLQIMAWAWFIDTAVRVVTNGESAEPIIIPALCVAGLILYQWLARDLMKLSTVRLENALRTHFRTGLIDKRAKLQYRHIEDHDSWDLIARVSDKPEEKLRDGLDQFLSMISVVMQLIGIMVVIVAQVWWAALVMLVICAPMIWLSLWSGRASYDAERMTTDLRRQYEYLSAVLHGREAVEERTLFGFTTALNGRYLKAYLSVLGTIMKVRAKWFIRSKASSIAIILCLVAIAATLLTPTLKGTITIGMFIALVNSLVNLSSLFAWNISYSAEVIAKTREYLRDLTRFMALEETPGALDRPVSPAPEFRSLEFRDVRFCYPGSQTPILDGLSFKLNSGGHYAFVGVNGAGKTTITKLITGLYDNYEGEILLNGRALRDYAQSELKATLSLVYQDFARYGVSLADNIALGDMAQEDEDTLNRHIAQAIEQTDLNDAVDKLPRGMDTPLLKILPDGQDLSGGQWQRVAMARAIVSPAPLRILDEPTAALDPISESRVYEQFAHMSYGRTTLMISHRLGSTQLADMIYVIGEGRVLEQGPHAQLMEQQGLYAQMYESQRRWYQ